MDIGGVSKREMACLLIAIALSMFIHGAFVLRGFGEQDACQLARQAAMWSIAGQMQNTMYTVRTSPLYLLFLKTCMELGLPRPQLPWLMNWANVFCGSLILGLLYVIWRRLADKWVVVAGLLVYSFMPVVWLGNIYGMPHVPAMLLFLLALYTFIRARETRGWRSWVCWVIALGSGVLAVGTKADIVLCYGAFLWFALASKPFRVGAAAAAIAIPIIAVLSTIGITSLVASSYYSVSEYRQQFPFTITAVTDVENAAVPVMAPGIVLFAAIGLCCLYSLVQRKNLRFLTLIVFWTVPAVLFWCLKPGNNARHLMAAYAALALIVGQVIVADRKNRSWAFSVLAAILAVNYFASPSFSLPRTGRPSSRLIKAHPHVQARVDSWHEAGRTFASLPDTQKHLYGADYSVYGMWEVLASARTMSRQKPGEWHILTHDGLQQRVRFTYLPPGETMPVPETGWTTCLWVDDGLRSRIETVSLVTAP